MEDLVYIYWTGIPTKHPGYALSSSGLRVGNHHKIKENLMSSNTH